MSKALKAAAVEGFKDSFLLAATIVKAIVGALFSVVSAFAHKGS